MKSENIHIRVIAPSDSYKPHKADGYARAETRLRGVGVRLSFGKHVRDSAYLGTASAAHRAADLHAAYSDPSVDAVMALHGGFAENEMLPHIDWQLLKQNPKPFVGYSDNTVLLNAIHTMTGVTTWLGPNLGTLGHEVAWEYTLRELLRALRREPHIIPRSKQWDDRKHLHNTRPPHVIQPGSATGTLLGGNASTIYLLQGTPYATSYDTPFILAYECDDLAGTYSLHEMARNLESLLQQPGARTNIRGMLIGRFLPSSTVTMKDLTTVLRQKDLPDIPVVADLDFGHTTPMTTLPIGGSMRIQAESTATVEITAW